MVFTIHSSAIWQVGPSFLVSFFFPSLSVCLILLLNSFSLFSLFSLLFLAHNCFTKEVHIIDFCWFLSTCLGMTCHNCYMAAPLMCPDVIPKLMKINAVSKGNPTYFLSLFTLKITQSKNPWMATSENKQNKLSKQMECCTWWKSLCANLGRLF